MKKQSKITLAMAAPVGFVLFSSHAGGGFATGNQANTYYFGLGWLGAVAAIISMLLLTLTMREAMVWGGGSLRHPDSPDCGRAIQRTG